MPYNLKKRLSKDEPLIGAWLQSSSATIAEAMATCGFDWMAVDMEHGIADVEQASLAFAVCERHGVSPLVRLPHADPYLARRLLDAGAEGLLIPVAEEASAVSEFLSHCLYPPEGRRGVGLVRANQWGETFEDYSRNFKPVIVPMIETKKGVEAAGDIAAIPGVDGLFLGPYDLSANLGAPGDFDKPEFVAAVAAVREACAANNKAPGIHQVEPNRGLLDERIKEGFRFLAYGTDLVAVRHAFQTLKSKP
ncbi:MAG: 2,4-dihydroxyhept-2-ene-1,7-dioic acid aldolase [Alphaproteobacteria bacterium]|jgi:2-keto-3-deoxy-L-rhamnonate aldolase RhmA|nr:2,4-dihydroxyhept-2-ene-1,7-dioic acid aldolase [Alphaproteobacteria bacterium]MBT7944188.1 2,4-dihydroxyhept-2-ene-1,7-dioic acid aldolase [Alphaproteobacteria bacterium]